MGPGPQPSFPARRILSRMGEVIHRAEKGVLRAEVRVEGGVIREVRLSGDFFMHPPEALWELEERLRGVRADRGEIRRAVEAFMRERGVVMPMVRVEDLVEVVARGAEGH